MSALTPRGSTRAWRQLRRPYERNLRLLGVVPCGRAEAGVDVSPQCTRTIVQGQRWALGHVTDRALGGTDTDLRMECIPCSNHSGGKLGARIAAAGARQTARTPSRQW